MEAWLLDVDYITEHGRAVIRLWCKDDRGVFVAYDRNFLPYFYVLREDGKPTSEDILGIKVKTKSEIIAPLKVEEVTVKSLGKEVEAFKVYARHPQHVPKLREEIKKFAEVREADIPFAYRYLIDKDLACFDGIEFEGRERAGNIRSYEIESVKRVERPDFPDLKVLAFDCEMLSEFGMPNAEEDPIIVIGVKCGEYEELFYGDDEREIILKFVNAIKSLDPDIIVGYNQNNFDWPYLKKRAEKHGIRLDIGRDRSELSLKGGRPKIAGRLNVDLYDIALKMSDVKIKKLENVAEYLGTKVEIADIEAKDIYKFWTKGERDKVLRYAKQDVLNTYFIAEELLPMHYELSKLIRLPLDDVTRMGRGKQVDYLLLSEAHKIGEVAPNPLEIEESYEGAFVLEPARGLHENVICLDFAAMYPSIMIAYNISPDTLVKGKCEDCYVAPEVGHKFRKKPDGFFRRILKMLVERRKEIKRRMKMLNSNSHEYKLLDIKQSALKVLTNSILPDEWLPIIEGCEVKFVRIGEFIDRLMEENREKVKRVDDSEVLEVDGIKAFSFNRDTKTSEIKPVKALIRHRYEGNVYRIELESGRKIRITEGHSLFTVRGGEITEISGGEVKKGDLILVPKVIRIDEREVKLNIPKILSKLRPEETENIVLTIPVKGRKNFFKGMLRTLKWLFGEDERKIRTFDRYVAHLRKIGLIEKDHVDWNALKAYRTFCERIAEKVKYDRNKREYVVRFNDIREIIDKIPDAELEAWNVGTINGFKMKAVFRIDEDFGKLLGYYVSEGYSNVQKNRRGYSYTVRMSNHDEEVLDDIQRLAEKFFGKVIRSENYVEIPKKIAYLIFHSLCGSKADTKRIPEVIFVCPESVRWAFLEGYFIGDGDIHPSKRLRLSTKSELLANQLVFLLNSLGVSAVKIGFDSGVYRIYVNENLKFLNLRRERNSYYSNVVPKDVLEELTGRKFQKNVSFGRFKALLHDGGIDEGAKMIEWLIDGDLVLDRVKNVEVEKHSGWVYDLSVEDNENFLVGFGLIYAHNSFYGYTGWTLARWYCRECAEATTAWGRHCIKRAIKIAEGMGFEVLYCDTDSLFVKKDALGLEELEKEVSKLIDVLSKELPIQIEVDEYYRTIFFVEKKRYAGLTKDGRIVVKGLEVRRGDWCELAKRVQKAVIEIILKDRDPKKALDYVKEVIEEIRKGKIPLEDYVIYKSLTKPPSKYESKQAHVKAALRGMEMGYHYPLGSKVGFVIVKGAGNVSDRAYPVELIEDFDGEYLSIRTFAGIDKKKIDKDYYIDHQVVPAILRILERFGYTEAQIKGTGKQKTLDAFFS